MVSFSIAVYTLSKEVYDENFTVDPHHKRISCFLWCGGRNMCRLTHTVRGTDNFDERAVGDNEGANCR